jgi:hypothetical protein
MHSKIIFYVFFITSKNGFIYQVILILFILLKRKEKSKILIFNFFFFEKRAFFSNIKIIKI